MVLFGLGTIPLLLAVTIAGNFISLKVRNRINNFIPVIMVIMGILFILRGLSLGIPFLSPPDNKLMKVQKMGEKTLHQIEMQKNATKSDTLNKEAVKLEVHACCGAK